MLNGIHFVFQFLAGHGRDELFKRCFASWVKTLRPADSVVVITSNGSFTYSGLDNVLFINCPSILLSVNKRNMGISLTDKRWTMLVDDDILLTDYSWREKLEKVISTVGKKESFYSLAPRVATHKVLETFDVDGDQWCLMDRMGFNCVLAKTLVWKAIPHLNWAFIADKTYLDYITTRTKAGIFRHDKGLVDHMVTDRMKTHFIAEKFRKIKAHKNEWFDQMLTQINDIKSFLNNYIR